MRRRFAAGAVMKRGLVRRLLPFLHPYRFRFLWAQFREADDPAPVM